MEPLTTSNAAKLLEVSHSTLKRWADAGIIPYDRTTGGHRRFSRATLERFKASTRRGDTPGSRWSSLLLEDRESLSLEAALFRARIETGSWWGVVTELLPGLFDLHRRRDAGGITMVQWRAAFHHLDRALVRFLGQVSYAPDAPVALVASIQYEAIPVTATTIQLCAADSRWRTRWAGPASPEEIAEDLRKRPCDAIVVAASSRACPGAASRFAVAIGSLARAAGIQFGLAGLCEWPDGIDGAVKLQSFEHGREWLEALRAPRAA